MTEPRRPATTPQPTVDADRADEIEATTPAEGMAWLAVDGEPLRKVDVGADHRAVWRLSRPRGADDRLVVIFVNDTIFAAATRPQRSAEVSKSRR